MAELGKDKVLLRALVAGINRALALAAVETAAIEEQGAGESVRFRMGGGEVDLTFIPKMIEVDGVMELVADLDEGKTVERTRVRWTVDRLPEEEMPSRPVMH